jgi:hypothetical protein
MSTHFICKGTCNGVSPVMRRCGAKDCTLYDQPLVACSCTDGKHKMTAKKPQKR